MKKEMPKWWI